jgi:uncharacterized membrane protein YfcA
VNPNVFALVALGIGVGTFGTLVGAGGGFILTPVLLVLYPHRSATVLTAISITVVFFNAVSGSAAYAHQRRIDYASGIRFGLATLPGAVLGAFVVRWAPRSVFDVIMGVILGAVGVWLAVGRKERQSHPSGNLSRRHLVDRDGRVYDYGVPLRRGILFSLGIGFLSSFLGIGGGPFHVPLLVGLLGFPTLIATATSQFVLMFMSAAGSLTHVVEGHFHLWAIHRTIALSIGVVAGAQLGAYLSRHLSGHLIQRLLAVGLLILAVRLLVSA